ncbi:MAG: hypothetical protein H6Q26_2963, partial [Bacteroidetes bacterium]|nr:hypothetical protein [Bacteroidota bacterium]
MEPPLKPVNNYLYRCCPAGFSIGF